MIPLAVPNIGVRERELVAQALHDNWVSTLGPFVDQFERTVAEVSGVRHAVAVAAGTMGLHAALHGLGVGRGDLVILPSFTFVASANAISHAGARPWLFDIAEESWTLDADQLACALEEDCVRDTVGILRHRQTRERVAAIMPVYTLGLPADMDRIAPIAKTCGLPIVGDAAAALGARYKGSPIGGLADATVYSFNGNKTVTSGGGGMIVGKDAAFMARLKHLTTTARLGPDYDHDEIGFNYRMTNVEAAIGCAQMERLGELLAAKRRIRAVYNAAFSGREEILPFPEVTWAESACWFSGIVIAEDLTDKIIRRLREHDVMARKFWKPMHLQLPYRNALKRPTPVTDAVWAKILTLPSSTQLTEAEQQKVIKIVMGAL
ncbi:MAG: aminotransferase class I/II-fold pyridoxal phosphate-dependent enzyme [Alphaproteobacteria bacterium]